LQKKGFLCLGLGAGGQGTLRLSRKNRIEGVRTKMLGKRTKVGKSWAKKRNGDKSRQKIDKKSRA